LTNTTGMSHLKVTLNMFTKMATYRVPYSYNFLVYATCTVTVSSIQSMPTAVFISYLLGIHHKRAQEK
jgi:hypothetical protein